MKHLLEQIFPNKPSESFDISSLVKKVPEKVEPFPVSFPIYHYFKEKLQREAKENPFFEKFLEMTPTMICTLIFKKEEDIKKIPFEIKGPVKKQQEMIQFLLGLKKELNEDIPKDDIQHELLNFQKIPTSPKKKSPNPPKKISLQQPTQKIRKFRKKVKGRSWISPNIYSLVYLIWTCPQPFNWKLLPSSVVRHTNPDILHLLNQKNPHRCSPALWIQLLNHLPVTVTHVLLENLQKKLQLKVPPNLLQKDLLQIWITIHLPHWDQVWTQMPWIKNRSTVKKIQNIQKQHYFPEQVDSLFLQTFKQLN